MDTIIQKADFCHDDEAAFQTFDEKLSSWIDENEYTCTEQQFSKAFELLGQKLLGKTCPTYKSNGWKQADEAYDRLIQLSGDLIRTDRMESIDLHKLCLKQSLEFHRYGPATIQVEVMEKFKSNRVYLKEYTETLEGPELLNVISAVCTPIVKREDTKPAKFYLCFKKEIESIMQENLFNDNQLQKKEFRDKMLNYAIHLFMSYSDVPKEGFVYIPRAARVIFEYYKDDWMESKDITELKSFIQQIAVCVKKPGFPQNEEIASGSTDLVYLIREKAKGPQYLEKLGGDIIDLLRHISRSKSKHEEQHIEFFKAVLNFFRDNETNEIDNKPEIFTALVPPFEKLLAEIDNKFLYKTYYVRDIICVLERSFGKNKKYVKQWLGLAVAMFRRPCDGCLSKCRLVLGVDTIYKWKDHQEIADQIFQAITTMQLPEEEEKTDNFFKSLTSSIKYFLEGLKKSRILNKYGEGLMFLSLNMLEMKEKQLYETSEEIAERIEINVKEHKKPVMEVMNRLYVFLKDDDLPWNTSWVMRRAVEDLLGSVLGPVEDGRIFTNDDMRLFVSMCVTCLNHDGLNPEDSNVSSPFHVAMTILYKLLPWLGTTKRIGLAAKIIPLLMKFFDEDDEDLNSKCARLFSDFAQYEPSVMAPYLGQLIKIYLDKDDPNILRPINKIYPVNPEALKEHFEELMSQLLDRAEQDVTCYLSELFYQVSRKQPELFTEKSVKGLIERVKNDTANQTRLTQILQELSRRKPEMMVTFIDDLMAPKVWDVAHLNFIYDMVCSLALNQKKVADKVLDFLLKNAQECQDESNAITALNSVRQVGYKYPSIIKPKRPQIDHLKLADPNTEGLRRSIIDMIDGKTPKDLQRELEERQKELNDLVNKVEEVELTVVAMLEDIDNQGEELKNVKSDVKEQGQRLDQVEETVEETVIKVEEIDSKTLSHAPYWSRDISKLLNPQTEHDWRLLSSRLGYSNDDIRGWAQQADPCMAMLNEWYATRKTSEATLAILTHLQEMDRMDAAIIVENAMKNAEAVVEDEDFVYASPPPIFISYQWGHQEEVKLLKKHLEMAGFECWMDIGQMGGGDKLFEKIDSGIRAAKIVISCISNKYTKSPNCNREVNLSVGLHKPVIPLLLEQCPWPPPGSMGPIFSESLFIRFFQRQGEETIDDRYWSEPKFLELLMQLNMNGVPPDEVKIEPVYKNWWLPIEQEIKIDKNRAKNAAKASPAVKSDSEAGATESPDVFISYQWGKQKNIIKLYERLTSVGFSCWLDIKQMGGGDSLYDKIDRGIRGSKVVLSCVTQKYSLSPNCRREVSLADALKRPLIPLLLEKMTWPPPGPMSMVMTQLLYIGFAEDDQQTSWQGPQFDELINKIHQHIPDMVDIQSKSDANDEKPNNKEKKENKKETPSLISKAPTQKPKANNKEEKEKKKETPSLAPKAPTQKPKPNNKDEKENKETPSLAQKPKEKVDSVPPAESISSKPANETEAPEKPPENSVKPKAVVKPLPSEQAAPSQLPQDLPPPTQPQKNQPPPPQPEKKSKTCSII